MFGAGADRDCGEGEDGGGVIVMVRCEGKSEGVGDLVGIVAVWVLFCARCERNWLFCWYRTNERFCIRTRMENANWWQNPFAHRLMIGNREGGDRKQ